MYVYFRAMGQNHSSSLIKLDTHDHSGLCDSFSVEKLEVKIT